MVSQFEFKLGIAKSPCFKLLIPFCLGIIIVYVNDVNQSELTHLFTFLLGLLPVLFLLNRKNQSPATSCYLFICFLFFGMQLTLNQLPQLNAEDLENNQVWLAILEEEPIEREKVIRFKLNLLGRIDRQKVKQLAQPVRVQGLLQKDSLLNQYGELGDTILIKGRITNISKMRNPNAFDYKAYLKSQGVQYQIWFRTNDYKIIANQAQRNFESIISNRRRLLYRRFHDYIPDQTYASLAAAITFGYRTELSSKLMETFSTTGTIHILSVSGMHVGILFGFLSLVLMPLRLIRHGRLIAIVLALLLIWLFALLCGLVPAVLRATVMFSLFLIALWARRDLIGMNSLAGSALILLIANPLNLFDMGFQLSYLAVFGIMSTIPIFKRFYYSFNSGVKEILDIVYMSMGAQISTTALATYYFQQFPTYFLVGNLIMAIPSSLILIAGMFLSLSPFNSINHFLGTNIQSVLLYSHKALQYIESLPFSSIKGISINWKEAFAIYFLLMVLLIALRFKNKWMLFASMLAVLILGMNSYQKNEALNTYQGLRIYQMGREYAIAYIQRREVILFGSADTINQPNLKFNVHRDVSQFAELKQVKYRKLTKDRNYSLKLGERHTLAICNSHCTSQAKFILLRNDARLISNNRTSLLVFDGSNSWSSIRRYTTELDALAQPYYILKDNFAYVWDG